MATKTTKGVEVVETDDVDADALLASMASQSKGKSKGEKPSLTDKALDEQIAKWIEADKKETEWHSIKVTAESQILAQAAPARLGLCRRVGAVESTFTINGKLKMTQKCQYSAIPAEAMSALKQAFGDDAAVYFKERTELSLTEAAAADKDIVKTLIKALGPAKFAASFKAKKVVVVSEAFHKDFTLKPGIEAKAKEFMDQGIIKPYKPSLGIP